MVEIIGNVQELKNDINCTNCAKKLSYVKNEIQVYHGKDYSGGYDGKQWIVCPNCGDKVIIKSW